jgi:hypothetical protein
MALSVGEVAVDFVANLDDLFKSLEKLGEKLDEALSGKQEIKVSFDERIIAQIDKMADGVEKISNLTERVRTVAEGVFDSLDGRIGNTSEQIEKSFGGAVKNIEGQTDDFITTFINKVTKGVSRLSPLVLGQLFGATLLIERLVAGGFKLTSILPKFLVSGTGAVGIMQGLVQAVKTLNFPFLLGFLVDVSQSLLSVTTVVALLTTGLRGLTGLALRFLGKRPESQVQKFVVLLETLNAGLTDMLAKTRIFIERMFFITSGLTSIAGLLTILGTGVTGLTAVVSPFLAAVFVGISGIRLAAARVSDMLLRFRASAGDGRAQTTLFLRALRSLFPILDAIARNAKPIAKMINEFAKGGFAKRMKQVIGEFQKALSGISRIEDAINRLAATMEKTSKQVMKQMGQFISKADELFKKIGRQGARDALASIERVRSSATSATKEVQQSVAQIAPAADKAEKSATRLGARLVEMGKRTLGLIGRTGVAGTGSLLGLMLFGTSGNIAPFLAPLAQFRDRLLGGFSEVSKGARQVGDTVAESFGSGAAVEAATGFLDAMFSTLGGLLDVGVELSKKFWGVFVDPATLTSAFAFAGQTVAGLAPLLATGAGAVLTPLVLRGVKNLTVASAGVIRDAASGVWPVVRKSLVEPVKDFLLFLPRQTKRFATQTVPDMVNRLTARVFKGTVAVGERVKQFFGLAELTEEQANEKAIAAIQERTAGMREQRSALKEQLNLLQRSKDFGEDEVARRAKLKQVEDQLTTARSKAAELERKLKGDLTVDPEGAKKKLAATREEIKRLAQEASTLDAPFTEVQQRIIEAETQLRSLTDALSKELSQEAIEKLTADIKANSRPIRSAIANVGIDAGKSFASGMKAATSLVRAVLVSPFSSAATKRNIQAAASNLSKSFRSAFSAAFRIGGGILGLIPGLKGIGERLKARAGTTAGLTAGTPEEEAAKRKAAADVKAAKAQDELTQVLRAEKVVAEAAIRQKELEKAASELQINNQMLMSGQLEKTENVMREMTGSFLGLANLAGRLEETTNETATSARLLSKNLRAADFQPAIDLARQIDQSMPSLQDMRSQFERLADAVGMDVKTREAARAQLDAAEDKITSVLGERAEALVKLTGSDSLQIEAAQKELKALEAKAASDLGTVQDQEAVVAQRVKVAKMVQAAETKLIQELKDAEEAVNVNSAAFAKWTKEIDKQQAIIDTSGKSSKAGKEAQEKLTRAMENRQKVAATAENELTKRVDEVQQVMLASRAALNKLPNAVKDFAATFNRITNVEGVQTLASLAAQEAAGEELRIFTDQYANSLKEQAAEIELQQQVLKEEEAAARALLKEKRSSAVIQKELDAALKLSTIREEQLAVAAKGAQLAMEDIKVAEEETADAATKHEKALQQGTSATKEMSTQALRVAGALEKAKLAIDEGGQSMKELAVAADETATGTGTAKPPRSGARIGQGQTGQLADLAAVLLSGATAKDIEKAPLTPIRERMKNAPEVQAIQALVGTEDALERVLAILNQITQQPVQRLKKLSDGFSNLLTLLKRLEASPERLEKFTQQFSGEVIGDMSRMVGLMDKMVANVKKLKVPGGAGARGQLKGFESFALRTQAQLMQKAMEGAIDWSTVIERWMAALRAEFPNVKIDLSAGQQVLATELELAARNALKQVMGRLSARGNQGEKLVAMIFDGARAAKSKAGKAGEEVADEFAANFPQSMPRRGPLREMLTKLPMLGQMIGQRMLAGIGVLKELTSQFMRQGFEGFLPAAFNMGASVAEKFFGGLGSGLNKIGDALRKIPVIGILGEIPLKVAGFIAKGLGVITAGIAKMAAQVSGAVTNLVKETSTKLLKLGLDATRLRLDPNNLQRFNEAMGILGGSASDAEAGLQQLTQSIEQVARGSAPELEAAFADAGLSMQDLSKLGSDEIFLRIAKAANEATGDIRKQSDLLRLIGADFSSLRGVVLSGSEAIADAFTRANKNPPISQKTLELASKFTGVMSQIEQTIERIKIIVFEELAPVLNDALETFGKDSRTQIDFILENVRTAVRIVINTIMLVADFINKRYIQAGNGAEQLFADIVVAGRIAWNAIGDLLGIAMEHGVRLAGAVLDAAWNSLEGKSKSKLFGVLVWFGGLLGKAGASIIALVGATFESALVVGGNWVDEVKIIALKLGAWLLEQSEGLINKIGGGVFDVINAVRAFFGEEALDIPGLDKLVQGRLAIEKSIASIAAENAKENKKSLSFAEQFSKIFGDISKKVDEGGASLQKMFDTSLATDEVNAFLESIEGASDEAERLSGVIDRLNKDGTLDFALSGEESVERLRSVLVDFAERGIIPPGAVSEGTERLRKEAIKALGDVADETGQALKTAFEVGFDKLADEFPEVVELLKQIGIEGQRELDATAVRLANLRKEQEKNTKEVKKNLAAQHAVTLELIEQRRVLDALRKGFDLRRELRSLTDSFVGPFEEAARKVEELKLQMQEKILELQETFAEFSKNFDLDDQLAATIAMAEGLGLATTKATSDFDALTTATFNLVTALQALSSADTPEKRAKAEQDVLNARAALANAQANAKKSLGDLQGKITKDVKKGFEDGIRVAGGKPIVDILRNNLIVPVLGAFKETIKGLVDGTLVEAAREAEKVAEITGQKFSRALFIIADFGKRIFETAFDSLLESTFNNLTEGLSASIQDAFKDAEGSASTLGDAAGAAIAAAIQAAIALAGLILSRLQGEISATEEAVESIVDSSEAIRGVISGSTTVAIKEAEDAFRDAQRPIVVRLDTIIGLMRSAIAGGSIPTIPLSGAGGTAIP